MTGENGVHEDDHHRTDPPRTPPTYTSPGDVSAAGSGPPLGGPAPFGGPAGSGFVAGPSVAASPPVPVSRPTKTYHGGTSVLAYLAVLVVLTVGGVAIWTQTKDNNHPSAAEAARINRARAKVREELRKNPIRRPQMPSVSMPRFEPAGPQLNVPTARTPVTDSRSGASWSMSSTPRSDTMSFPMPDGSGSRPMSVWTTGGDDSMVLVGSFDFSGRAYSLAGGLDGMGQNIGCSPQNIQDTTLGGEPAKRAQYRGCSNGTTAEAILAAHGSYAIIVVVVTMPGAPQEDSIDALAGSFRF